MDSALHNEQLWLDYKQKLRLIKKIAQHVHAHVYVHVGCGW